MTDFLNSGLLLDIIIVLMILLNVIVGAKRGFIKTVYNFFRLIIAAAAGIIFCRPLAVLLKETAFYRDVLSGLEESIGKYISDMSDESFEMLSEQAEKFTGLLDSLGRSASDIEGEYARLAAENSENITESITTYIITPASEAIITAIAFLGIFFVTLLALFVIMKVLDLVAKAPVINFANKALGFAAGFIVAFVCIFIFSMILDGVMPYIEGLDIGITKDMTENSALYKWFSGINPLGLIIAFLPARP